MIYIFKLGAAVVVVETHSETKTVYFSLVGVLFSTFTFHRERGKHEAGTFSEF